MKFSPYSISKSECYVSCPKHFDLKYIQKIKVPFKANVALYKGNYIHQIIENNYDYNTEFKTNEVFKETDKERAASLTKIFEDSDLGKFYKTKAHNPTAKHEEKFGFKIVNGGLEVCGYWDKKCWYRGAIDFNFKENGIIFNVDWKSGKDKSQDENFGITQSKMYAIYLMLKNPHVNVIISKFVFIEHCTEKTIIYRRENMKNYIKDFYDITSKIENATQYPPKTSALCNWCDYQQHGHCTSFIEENERNTRESNNLLNSKINF